MTRSGHSATLLMCCALIISGIWGTSARSGGGGDVGIPHEQLECRTSFKVIQASRSLSRDSRAYRADNDERILFFDPDVYFRQPPVVGALEFAKSCLTLTRRGEFEELSNDEQLCQAIQFLQRQGAFEFEALNQLEEFAFSVEAEGTGFDARALKSAFSCYWEK